MNIIKDVFAKPLFWIPFLLGVIVGLIIALIIATHIPDAVCGTWYEFLSSTECVIKER